MQCEATPNEAAGTYITSVSFFFSEAFTPAIVEGISQLSVVGFEADLDENGAAYRIFDAVFDPVTNIVNQTGFTDERFPLQNNRVYVYVVSSTIAGWKCACIY